MFSFITKKSIWINILAGILIMVICLYLLYLFLGPLTRHGKNKTVPDVSGKSFAEAKAILRSSGFDYEIQDSIYVDTSAKGTVLRQLPEGNAVVKFNRTVYLILNRYVPPFVEMPNLIGYSFRNAEMQLKNLGLRLGDTIFRPDFAKNSVLEQRFNGAPVAPGTKIQEGSSVSLVLGDGIGKLEFTVPDLVGSTFSEGKMLLEANGLTIGAVMAQGITDTANAYIMMQNPKRFDEFGRTIKIRAGQTMDVWLSLEKPVIDTTNLDY